MNSQEIRDSIYKVLEDNNGILRLKSAWVARQDFKGGRNLGLKDSEYDKGIRGEITERWICSETNAQNKVGPPDEGLSYIAADNSIPITLQEAVRSAGDLIMGEEYFKKYGTLKRLIKILDYSNRLIYHYHQMEKDAALVNLPPKDEAYYFPDDAVLGPQPETFFGVHPYIAQQKKYDIILKHLIDWNSDQILKHSRAYAQVRDDGFHLPAGIPHAPGSALTIELQESSDVFGMLQAMYNGEILSKEFLYRNIREEDRIKHGEKIVLGQIDWEKSGDPYFYENRHTPPILIEETKANKEYWIFYNTNKFSGKKLVVFPGETCLSREKGVYSILIWRGKGKLNGLEIEAKNHSLDELIVPFETAVGTVEIKNTGGKELHIYKFFGPDINPDVKFLPNYKG